MAGNQSILCQVSYLCCHKTVAVLSDIGFALDLRSTRSMVESPIDFSILAGLGAPVREFKAGQVIFHKEDTADVMYIIKSGKVEIRFNNRLLESLSANNIFGEMALIESAPRSATAIAATDVQLVPIGEKQFSFLVSQTPHFALNVMRVMTRRLRAMNSAV